jgi:hypothetical protein
MNLATASENTDAQRNEIQLTLSRADVRRLQRTVPWLLRALADRPTTSPVQRERRREAHAALEGLLSALSNQLQPGVESPQS